MFLFCVFLGKSRNELIFLWKKEILNVLGNVLLKNGLCFFVLKVFILIEFVNFLLFSFVWKNCGLLIIGSVYVVNFMYSLRWWLKNLGYEV